MLFRSAHQRPAVNIFHSGNKSEKITFHSVLRKYSPRQRLPRAIIAYWFMLSLVIVGIAYRIPQNKEVKAGTAEGIILSLGVALFKAGGEQTFFHSGRHLAVISADSRGHNQIGCRNRAGLEAGQPPVFLPAAGEIFHTVVVIRRGLDRKSVV